MVAEDAEQTLKDMGLRVTKKPMVRHHRRPRRGRLLPACLPVRRSTGGTTVIVYVSRSEVAKDETSRPEPDRSRRIEDARNEVKGLNLLHPRGGAGQRAARGHGSEPELPTAGTDVRKSQRLSRWWSPPVSPRPSSRRRITPSGGDGGSTMEEQLVAQRRRQPPDSPSTTDGSMWNENGQQCDAQGNPIALTSEGTYELILQKASAAFTT